MAKLSPGVIEAQATRRFNGGLTVHVFDTIDSTNSWLRDHVKAAPVSIGQGIVCAAEHQIAGRGRRGKTWHSPSGGVTFSTACTIPFPPCQLSGLSLLCGVALCTVLRSFGVADACVKWPNDIFVGDKKLAGVLLEVLGVEEDCTTVITGIGVNYRRGPEASMINQLSTDLFEICGDCLTDRAELIGALAGEHMRQYSGNVPLEVERLAGRWRQYDALQNRVVRCESEIDGEVTGTALGIDKIGKLLLKTDDGVRSVAGGSVTIVQQSPLSDN